MTDNVTPRQQIAITALLTGSNLEQAAQAANVSPRTLYRWMRDDAFAKALDQAQADITHQAARKLANLLNEGVDGLGTLLKTANLPPMERLRIIQTILQAFPKLHETITLEDRLDRLEKELEQ
ncbi:MAG: hypothetical protein HUU11_17455 [Anaerolineales bacterium]|nr:hypothetical protein [Anaerolineales bacterium]